MLKEAIVDVETLSFLGVGKQSSTVYRVFFDDFSAIPSNLQFLCSLRNYGKRDKKIARNSENWMSVKTWKDAADESDRESLALTFS